MHLLPRAKGNNFSPSLSRLEKLGQNSPKTVPNPLSFTPSPSRLAENKREHRKSQSRPPLSPLPSKEFSMRTSREENHSAKQNVVYEVPHLINFLHLPPGDRREAVAGSALDKIYLPIPLSKNLLSNAEKARMIRELNLKIELLQSKSKQPGLRLQDLAHLREEIYNKFDQYYITNRQGHSRFIDSDQQDLNLKVTARQSRVRKASKEFSTHLKVQSKTSSPRSSQSQQSSSEEKAKPHSSKVIPSFNEEVVNKKTYKTVTNISVVSLTNRSNNQEEERPIFETELSEHEIMDLDREPERRMSELEEGHHESYIELKENVRIMEERIGFLIHRLEENKRQIGMLKETKEMLQKNCAKKQKEKIQYNLEKMEMKNNLMLVQTQEKRLRQKYEQKQKEIMNLQKQVLILQKNINQLTNENEYLSQKLKLKEHELASVQQLLIHKKGECQQLAHNLRSLQRQLCRKRKEFISQIQLKQQQSEQLKRQLKEQKARMEVQGINFKFQEATKLKIYIEQNEILHQRQIQKLDSSYSSVIHNYEEENRKIKNEKIRLENALIEWLGTHGQFHVQDKYQDSQFRSNLIKLEAIELNFGQLTANQISRQLVILLEGYSQLEKEKVSYMSLAQKLQERICILKEQYAQIFHKKTEQIQNVSQKCQDLTNINQVLSRQKEELQQELKQAKQTRYELKVLTKQISPKICLKVLEYRYPQPQLAHIQSGVTFEKIFKKLNKAPLKRKLQISIKLIDLALSFAGRKKMPTLNPTCLIIQFTEPNRDFSIEASNTGKEDEDQNLHYCSPQVLLGFNETHHSHCWTIGIILDRMIHGKQFFSQYSEIISRKENYVIRDEKYKGLDFLYEMLRKNQRQRIGLEEVRLKIANFIAISHLQ